MTQLTILLILNSVHDFIQSAMMKSMIENGARQGLKDSFDQFSELLGPNAKVRELKDLGASKEQILAYVKPERESGWRTALRFFTNFIVISSFFAAGYVLVHIAMAKSSVIQGLEFLDWTYQILLGNYWFVVFWCYRGRGSLAWCHIS
jgi:hypothetical protein